MNIHRRTNAEIYVINLDEDSERLAFMTEQLAELGLMFNRVKAIRGLDMPDWLQPYFLTSDGQIASTMQAGEVGCYASHLIALKRVAEGNRPALILEDDVEIAPDFPAILDAIGTLPEDWDTLRFTNASKRLTPIVSLISDRYALIKFSRVPNSAGAYLITPRGAAKFLAWKTLRTLPVDHDLARGWDCKLTTYGIYPRPITHPANRSSIDIIGRRKFKVRKASKHLPLTDNVRRAAFEFAWLGPIDYARSFIRSPRYVKRRMQAQSVALAQLRLGRPSASMHPDMHDPALPNHPAI